MDIRPLWSRQDWSGRLPASLHEELSIDRQVPALLACQGETIIGWAYTADRSNQLLQINITEAYRRKGHGSRLLRSLGQLLTDYGCSRLELETELLEPAHSRAFFQKMGPSLLLSGKSQSSFKLESWLSPEQLKLLEVHRQLGIPDNYGISRALRLHADAVDLTAIGEDCWQRPQRLATEAAAAWSMMHHHAALENIQLVPVSAYRSIQYQTLLLQRKLDKGQVIEEILKVSAAPGFSEHHSGRAIDITTTQAVALETKFAQTSAYQWLNYNAEDYGFYLSYPQDNPHGIAWEPWHWCWAPE